MQYRASLVANTFTYDTIFMLPVLSALFFYIALFQKSLSDKPRKRIVFLMVQHQLRMWIKSMRWGSINPLIIQIITASQLLKTTEESRKILRKNKRFSHHKFDLKRLVKSQEFQKPQVQKNSGTWSCGGIKIWAPWTSFSLVKNASTGRKNSVTSRNRTFWWNRFTLKIEGAQISACVILWYNSRLRKFHREALSFRLIAFGNKNDSRN